MLKSFELLKKHRDIEPFKVEFLNGLNVVVGDNGFGKSTMLQMITANHIEFKKGQTIFKCKSDGNNRYVFFMGSFCCY